VTGVFHDHLPPLLTVHGVWSGQGRVFRISGRAADCLRALTAPDYAENTPGGRVSPPSWAEQGFAGERGKGWPAHSRRGERRPTGCTW